jgi:hypothetical protein
MVLNMCKRLGINTELFFFSLDENCVSDEARQRGGITKWLHGSKLKTFFCSFFLMNV